MTVFWLLVALLVMVALVFIIPPILRQPRALSVDSDELNVHVIRDQLAELQADLESGRLGQADYEAARHDLQRELLDDVDSDAKPTQVAAAGRGRWLAAPLAIAVPLMAVLIYQQIGTQAIIQQLADGPSALPVGADGQSMSIEAMVAKLAARMQEDPDNLEGWLLLGRSLASMNRFADAAEAYRHAMRLDDKNPDLLSSYADVLVMASNGEFTDQVGELLDQALDIDPKHLKSRWLRGHWRFRHDDFKGAIDDWQTVKLALPPDDEKLAMISQQIDAARSRLGEPVAETAGSAAAVSDAASASAAAAGIEVRVALDPALQAKAGKDDIVFIFARAVQGPRMPLAIVRKQVADLPLSVTLDDSLAMSPAMVLSGFDQVLVGARISKSGQAMPASGDLQGQVSPVSTQGGEVELTIDSVIP